jgi:hypothetical protein
MENVKIINIGRPAGKNLKPPIVNNDILMKNLENFLFKKIYSNC